ncbi:MAG: hypothetical protein AAGA59_02210 [Actinomycetota bacterium]
MINAVLELREGSTGERLLSPVLGRDRLVDVIGVLATFVLYLVLDRLSQALVAVGFEDLGSFSLVVSSIAGRWWLYLAVGAVFAAGLVLRPERMLARWSDLDHGRTLQLMMLPLIVLLGWKGGFYAFNFFAGEIHLLDRLLAVALAVGAWYRPILLLAFVTQLRVINEQLLFPFGTISVETIDDYLLIPLIACAAGHALYVLTGRRSTSPVLLVIVTSIAGHFFLPGRGKLAIDWFGNSELSNLPLASYTAGFGAATDGAWARFMADFFETMNLPVMIGTLLLELGVLAAVVHLKLFRWWLPGMIVFHAFTFAATGFFFFSWIVLEAIVLVILFAPGLRDWVAENATPARGAIAFMAVLGSPVLFHAPGLAWIDGPISYGYELEAVGESGTAYHVPLSTFAPLEHEMTFGRPQLSATEPLTGGYGSMVDTTDLDRLEAVETFEQLEALEARQPATTLVETSQDFLLAFFDGTHVDRSTHWPLRFGPPLYFWSGRPAPSYDYDEPLVMLEVYQVTAIHGDDGEADERRIPVLRIEQGPDGSGVIVDR